MGYKGRFKGVYHVYLHEGRRYIEEFMFESFEDILPSASCPQTMSDEFRNGSYENQFLELPEVESIKSDEFYFEILGYMEINFYKCGSYEYPNEFDSEMLIDRYVVKQMVEKEALAFGGFDNISEVIRFE